MFGNAPFGSAPFSDARIAGDRDAVPSSENVGKIVGVAGVGRAAGEPGAPPSPAVLEIGTASNSESDPAVASQPGSALDSLVIGSSNSRPTQRAFQAGAFQAGAFQGVTADVDIAVPSAVAQAEVVPPEIVADPARQAAHHQLMARVVLLEASVAGLLAARQSPGRKGEAPGIGHNGGPFEDEPVGFEEIKEIENLIALLKEQGPQPSAAHASITVLGERVRMIGEKIGPYFNELGLAFARGAGQELGKRLVQAPFWLAIAAEIPRVVEALNHWLSLAGN
jgi:hypothetical protein